MRTGRLVIGASTHLAEFPDTAGGASMILEQAHASATEASTAAVSRPPLPEAERQELRAEVTYLRTFSDVGRTHVRA
jgi:hypothetical protein